MPWIIISSVLGFILIVFIIISIITTRMVVNKCFKRMDFDYSDEERIERSGIIKDFFEDKECREVMFKSYDDTLLTGYYVTNGSNNKKVVILHHGYHSDHMSMTPYGKMYYELGYDLLFVDSRNCGKSEGKYTTFGVKEARDIEKWIDQLVFMKGKNIEIILSGVSMGAVISILAANTESGKYLKAVVSDCAYTSFNAQMEYMLKKDMIKNNFLKKFSKLIIALMNIGVFLYCGFDLRKSSPIEAVSTSKIPTLFIHGTADELVPYSMGEELFEKATCTKELVSFEDVGHARSINKEYEKYKKVVSDFINNLE